MQPLETIAQLRDEGRWLEAASLCAEDLEQDASSRHAWVEYAHMLKEGGAFEEALYAYRAAVRRDGTDPDPQLHLAHLLKRMEQPQQALEAFKRLQALPGASEVGQEMLGLEVALIQDHKPGGDKIFRSEGIANDACAASFHRLKSAEEARIVEAGGDSGSGRGSVGGKPASTRILPWGLLTSSREIKARLVPSSDLIIRDDVLIATTARPQLRIDIDGEGLQPGWFEIELTVKAATVLIEPVLFLEQAPNWSLFSFVRLEPDGEDRYRAVGYLEAPASRLRLDPLAFEGAFEARDFRIRQIGVANAVRAAHRRNSMATRKAVHAIRSHRSAAIFERDIAAVLLYPGADRYQKWISAHDTPTVAQIDRQIRTAGRWLRPPVLSVIVTGATVEEIETASQSLIAQHYKAWTGHLVEPVGLSGGEAERFSRLVQGDPRFVRQPTLLQAIAVSVGDYVLLADGAGQFAPSALYKFAEKNVAKPFSEILYCDEDHIDGDGRRYGPLFKPDWDPDYFQSSGYLGNLVCIRTARIQAVATALAEPDAFDIVVRSVEGLTSETIAHIPFVLYHRQTRESARHASMDMAPLSNPQRKMLALAALARRENPNAIVEMQPVGLVKVSWPLPQPAPRVTVIIPTRDRVNLLRACIDSLLEETAYPHVDILVVDNDSTEAETLGYFDTLKESDSIRVMSVPGEFNFSRLNNLAAAQAPGEILALVNNDILAIDNTWLGEMVSHAVRPDVGAVGAKLVYKSGHVQHAGVVCGIGLVAGHPHKFRASEDLGFMGRLKATQTFSAVTAACLVVEKRKFLEVGGFDETNLQIAFNDVDLCLKLDAAGYRSVFTPHAELVHLESISRGLDMSLDKTQRYRKEADFMLRKWSERIKRDPYYNPNLTTDLEDFSFKD